MRSTLGALTIALSLTTTGADAMQCTYVDQVNDKATYDLATGHLDITWADYMSGRPVKTEHCETRPVGVEMLQIEAGCEKDSYWFDVAPARKGGKIPDIMALNGLVWYGTCK